MFTNPPSGAAIDLSQVPAAMPPPGTMANFHYLNIYKRHYANQHSVDLTVSTVAVLVRLYTRAFIKKSIKIDDCESCTVDFT